MSLILYLSQPPLIRVGPKVDSGPRFFSPGVTTASENTANETHQHHPASATLAEEASVSMRGGAGPPNSPYKGRTAHLYSHKAGRLEVDDTVESFINASLRLLGFNPENDWEFMVDQYDNQGAAKDKPFKIRWKRGPVQGLKVTKDDQTAWEMSILPRMMNFRQDWIVAVDYVRDDSKPAPEYLFPTIVDTVGKPEPSKIAVRSQG